MITLAKAARHTSRFGTFPIVHIHPSNAGVWMAMASQLSPAKPRVECYLAGELLSLESNGVMVTADIASGGCQVMRALGRDIGLSQGARNAIRTELSHY